MALKYRTETEGSLHESGRSRKLIVEGFRALDDEAGKKVRASLMLSTWISKETIEAGDGWVHDPGQSDIEWRVETYHGGGRSAEDDIPLCYRLPWDDNGDWAPTGITRTFDHAEDDLIELIAEKTGHAADDLMRAHVESLLEGLEADEKEVRLILTIRDLAHLNSPEAVFKEASRLLASSVIES